MSASATVAEPVVLPPSETPCQRRLDGKRTWGRTLAVRAGDTVLGVRCDTEGAVPVLEELLAPLRAPAHDHQVAPNFSVEIGDEDRPRRLFLAYRAHQVVARRHERDALLLDLVQLLDDLPRAMSGGHFALYAGTLLDPDGRAVLLPADVHRVLLPRRRQLADAGMRLLTNRTQRYDWSSGEIVTGLLDDSVRAAYERLAGDALPSRPLPVRLWCVGVQAASTVELSAADAVVASIGTVLNREQIGMGDTLRGLAAAASRHRTVGMPTMTGGAQASSLLALVN